MPIKMIALRTVYRSDERKEYAKGETFTVASKGDAERLSRRRKAEIAAKTRNRTDIPKAPAQAVPLPEPQPLATGNEYLRRDMTAQD